MNRYGLDWTRIAVQTHTYHPQAPFPSADSHTGTILGSCPFRSDHIHISLRHSPFAILSASHTTHDAPPVSVTRQLLSITHPRDPGFQFHYHSLISFKRVYWGIGDNPHKFTAIITSLHSPRYRPGEVSSILVSSYHITSLPSSYYAAKSFC